MPATKSATQSKPQSGPHFATAAIAGERQAFDCAVVGGGVTGLAAALLLARRCPGARVALVAPRPDDGQAQARGDLRTAALFPEAIAALKETGAWPDLDAAAEPLTGIRMVDVTGRLLRAPEVTFLASEVGEASFGFNIANAAIVDALERVADRTPALTRVPHRLGAVDFAASEAVLALADGSSLLAKVVVAADGRRSHLREAAGIATQTWDHAQSAITTRFSHGRPHHGISTELHGRGGPCTTVPLAGQSSSLVWMETVDAVSGLLADCTAEAAGPAFVAALAAKVSGFLGRISNVAPPVAVPLSSLVASRFAGPRLLLVGESAHAFPPIGAQGLNLGLRDCAVAVDLIAAAIASGSDPGGATVTDSYHRSRRLDIQARTRGVDLLNRSLISSLPMLPLARGAGLHAIRAIPALRRTLMRQGMTGLPGL